MTSSIDEWIDHLKVLTAPRDPWKPGEYCDRCQNTGEIDCHCGGDLCVCGEETKECPRCHGESCDPDWRGGGDDY